MGIESEAGRWHDLPRTTRLGEQPADSRHSRRSCRTPRRLALGYGGITSGDFLAAGQTYQQEPKQKTLEKTEKRNEVKGRRLQFRSGLLSRCTHEGGTGHADEDVNSNNSL